jgi:hypothetical protein
VYRKRRGSCSRARRLCGSDGGGAGSAMIVDGAQLDLQEVYGRSSVWRRCSRRTDHLVEVQASSLSLYTLLIRKAR